MSVREGAFRLFSAGPVNPLIPEHVAQDQSCCTCSQPCTEAEAVIFVGKSYRTSVQRCMPPPLVRQLLHVRCIGRKGRP